MTNKTYISLGTYKDGFNEGVRQTKAECKEKFKEMKEYFDKLELPDLECHFCGNTTYCNFIHRTDVINKIDEELQKADEMFKEEEN